MARHTFSCIDAHTCGNPVRVVADGGPVLAGATMIERRQHFLAEFDWVRRALMFEPRGHEVMSGSILYPSTRDDCDIALLFIEVSGCLPMCGHGTIGTVTVAIEQGLVTPKTPGLLRLDTPAGVVEAHYVMDGAHVDRVRIRNIASYLHAADVSVEVPGLGEIRADVAYGGNFYAIIEAQENFRDMADLSPGEIQRFSPLIRDRINQAYSFIHPQHPAICGLSHVMWTGQPLAATATARNAVFYGDKAIDRSPCGTGTSARMAQWAARGDLVEGQDFVHESIIGSQFSGRIEARSRVGDYDAIIPSIEGWARIHGLNTIFVDDRDPFAHGFLVT
ncbi:MAG: 4-hydroxyproline epimerase [Rhodospirillales bacterium]|nr:4-hydroxyproline epimerase [Rhodospirillales bacterium]